MDFRQYDDTPNWQQLYHVVLACGKANDPKSFAIGVLTHIKDLCTYDSALAYFLDSNGKVCSQYLLNIDERWSAMYLEYYANADSQRFSCYRRIQEGPNQTTLNVRDWGHEQSTVSRSGARLKGSTFPGAVFLRFPTGQEGNLFT